MTKRLLPMLVRLELGILDEPFNPQRDYYAAFKNEKNLGRLEQKPEAKIRMGEIPPHTKLLNVNYLLETSAVDSNLKKVIHNFNEKYYSQLKNTSLEAEIARRINNRKNLIRLDYENYWQKEKLKELDKNYILFKERARKAAERRNQFNIEQEEAYYDHQIFLSERNRFCENIKKFNRTKFDEAVLKSLEKIPKEIVLTGNSLQTVLNELANSNGADISRAYKKVEENILARYADQLNDHFTSNLPNIILYSISVKIPNSLIATDILEQGAIRALNIEPSSKVLRTAYLINKNSEKASADQLNDHVTPNESSWIYRNASTIDQRIKMKKISEESHHIEHLQLINSQRHESIASDKKQIHSRSEKIDDMENTIQIYWHTFDENHKDILRAVSSSATNIQEIINNLDKVSFSKIYHLAKRTQDNINYKYAESQSTNFSGTIPNIVLFYLSQKNDRINATKLNELISHENDAQAIIKTITERKNTESSEEIVKFLQDSNHEKYIKTIENEFYHNKDALAQKWNSIRSLKSEESQQMHWQQYDKLHQNFPRVIFSNISNLNTLLRELPYHSPSHVYYIFAGSKKILSSASDIQAHFSQNKQSEINNLDTDVKENIKTEKIEAITKTYTDVSIKQPYISIQNQESTINYEKLFEILHTHNQNQTDPITESGHTKEQSSSKKINQE